VSRSGPSADGAALAYPQCADSYLHLEVVHVAGTVDNGYTPGPAHLALAGRPLCPRLSSRRPFYSHFMSKSELCEAAVANVLEGPANYWTS
jgi:hypothetical protein